MLDESIAISRTNTKPLPLDSGDRVVLERRIAQLERRFERFVVVVVLLYAATMALVLR